MAGISREFLSANNDGFDVHLQGNKSSFLGRPHHLSSNFIMGHSDVSANNTPALGGNGVFTIPQDCDFLGKIDAVYKLGALTSTGSGANFPRWVDWLGFALIENVLVKWASNRIQEFNGDDLMVLHCLNRRSDDSLEDLVYGGLQSIPSERADLATAELEVVVPLDCLIFSARPAQYLPYNIEVVRDTLRIEIRNRPLVSVAESDASSISIASFDQFLRVYRVHVTEDEQNAILAEAGGVNPELEVAALSRVCTVQEHQDDNIIANQTTSQSIKMPSINRPTKELIIYGRQDSDLPSGSATSSSINRFNFQEIDNLELKGYGRTILPSTSGRYVKYRMGNMYHAADPSKNLYCISHSLAPQSPGDQYGYLNYNTISNPELIYKMPSTWSTTGKMNILAQTHNVYMVTQGDVRVINA